MEYPEEGSALLSKFYKAVEEKVRETQDKTWREGMSRKPSLDLYAKYKQKRGWTKVAIYNNKRGSTLLALARAGILPTRKHRNKFLGIYPHCLTCGMGDETIQHVLMECIPLHFGQEILSKRLRLFRKFWIVES